MSSLLLDTSTWDLTLDAAGNIAACTAPYQYAQDAACACRLFLGELYYDTTQGVNYAAILGKPAPLSYIKAQLVAAALSVLPAGASVKVFISSLSGRGLTGQVQVTVGGTTVATPISTDAPAEAPP